jgi:hypothetical protein
VARQIHSASLFTSLQAVMVRGVDMALLRRHGRSRRLAIVQFIA